MSDELKPCPFCGGKASYEEFDGWWSVGCEDTDSDGIEVVCIGFQSLTTFARKIDAATAWNRRASDALVAEAYEVAAKAAFERLFDDMCKMQGARVSDVEELCSDLVGDIRNLTPADAQAARDALIAETRRKALEEAAAVVALKLIRVCGSKFEIERHFDHNAEVQETCDAILAPIEKDKTNE